MNLERDTLAIAITTTEVFESLRRNTSRTASKARDKSQQDDKRGKTTALDEELRKFTKRKQYKHDKCMDLAQKIDTAFNTELEECNNIINKNNSTLRTISKEYQDDSYVILEEAGKFARNKRQHNADNENNNYLNKQKIGVLNGTIPSAVVDS